MSTHLLPLLRVDGVEREVMGVMPEGFRVGDLEAELVLPLPSEPAGADSQRYGIDAVARLAPGARPEAVAAHLTDLFLHRVTERYPADGLTARAPSRSGRREELEWLHGPRFGNFR